MKTKINYLLILVLAGFVLTGCCSMKHCGSCKMQPHNLPQWEYKTVSLIKDNAQLEAQINEASKGGWKLVAVSPQSEGWSNFIFERPKQ